MTELASNFVSDSVDAPIYDPQDYAHSLLAFKNTYHVGLLPWWNCLPNALRTVMTVAGKQRQDDPMPRIWWAKFGNGADDGHAYVVVDGQVFSDGVTAPVGKYPNLTSEALRVVGQDITTGVLHGCVRTLAGDGDHWESLYLGEVLRQMDLSDLDGSSLLTDMMNRLASEES